MLAFVNDYFVEPRMRAQDGFGFRLDRPRDVRRGPCPAHPRQQRQRAHDVADSTEQYKQHSSRHVGGFGGRLRWHHRFDGLTIASAPGVWIAARNIKHRRWITISALVRPFFVPPFSAESPASKSH